MAAIFSTEQQEVIDSRDENLLVAAAAGSGKTTVLVERIIRRICDPSHPVDVDRLLVVTFTNAAAREMKERILNAVFAQLEADPCNEHLQKQTALVHNAQITTIDSFCLFVLRNNFHTIGLDPAFVVARPGEVELLMNDTMDQMMLRYFEEGDEDFYHLVECYSKGNKDVTLEKSIRALYNFAMSYPWPEKWLEMRKKDYEMESGEVFVNSPLVTCFMDNVRAKCQQYIQVVDGLVLMCEGLSGPSHYADALAEHKADMEQMLHMSFAQLQLYITEHKFAPFSNKRDPNCDESIKEEIKLKRDEYKKYFEDIKTKYLYQTPDEHTADMNFTSRAVCKLADVTLRFKEMFDAAKRERNIVDFQDMEHMAVAILVREDEEGHYVPTDAALGYRDFFEEIMVDEYQDSNMVQELLLSSISREDDQSRANNRFMVGDVKQSIYRFRLARPEIFIEKYETYTSSGSKKRIDLHRNYRSRTEVIESVNAVFENIMHRQIGKVEYDANARLNPGAQYPPGKQTNDYQSELLLIQKPDGTTGHPGIAEATAIAQKIHSMMNDLQVTDKKTGQLRPLEYRDIAILLRATAGWDEDFRKVFEQYGIPTYVEMRSGYYNTTEIQDIVHLLQILSNPLWDIPFYGVLTSYFGQFTVEECAKIKSDSTQNEYYLYEKMCGYHQRHSDDEKVAGFLKKYEQIRSKITYVPIHQLITDIIEGTGYKLYVTALPGGDRRRANLEMLVSKAAEFAKTSYYGLFHFIRYLQLIEKSQTDEGEASVLDENANTTTIMSIHKSKGLEFPVCFVAGLGKKFNLQDTTQPFISDIDMGVGADYIDPKKRARKKTFRKCIVADKMKQDSIGEEIRVLYVAMTRAKEKLILSATVDDPMGYIDKADYPFDTGFIGMIMPSIKSHLDSLFHIQCLDSEDIILRGLSDHTGRMIRKEKLLTETLPKDDPIVKRLEEQLHFTYGHECLSKLYTKTTVSELKMEAMEEVQGETKQLFAEHEKQEYIPDFARKEATAAGTDRGTAYHRVLELLDFTDKGIMNPSTRLKALEQQKKHMVESGRMTADDMSLIHLAKLESFCGENLVCRMHEAAICGQLFKEQPFVIGLEASRVNPDFPTEETVLIQGIIDAYFEEDGQIVVLDYKTDRVSNDEELCLRYRAQLDYYAKALEQLTGKKVKEKLMYSFGLNKTIRIDSETT